MEGAARGLAAALVASVALHAAVLLALAPAENRQKQLVVRLEVMVAPPAPPASPEIPAPAAPKAAEKKEKVKRPAPVSVPEVAFVAPQVKAAPVDKAVVPPPPVPAVPVFSAPREIPAPDAATVGQYRAQLLGAAGRFKRYPDEARERSWTGNVVVRVAVDAGGSPEVGVRRSSGHAVLDEQALDMFRQAARTVPVPAPLRGTAFALDVRAIYGLED